MDSYIGLGANLLCMDCMKEFPINEHAEHAKSKTRERALIVMFKAYCGDKFYCNDCKSMSRKNSNHEKGKQHTKAISVIEKYEERSEAQCGVYDRESWHEMHPKVIKAITEGGEDDFNDQVLKVFKHKLWMVDLKSINIRLNLQFLKYKKVHGLLKLQDDCSSNSFLANLKTGVFTKKELKVMTKVALYLKVKEDKVNRSETIQDSKMSVFGMRSSQGSTGGYSHKHIDVYKLTLQLTEFVFDKLQVHYSCVFQHLNKI